MKKKTISMLLSLAITSTMLIATNTTVLASDLTLLPDTETSSGEVAAQTQWVTFAGLVYEDVDKDLLPTEQVDVALPQVNVQLYSNGVLQYEQWTKEDGSFSFTDMPKGTYDIKYNFDTTEKNYLVLSGLNFTSEVEENKISFTLKGVELNSDLTLDLPMLIEEKSDEEKKSSSSGTALTPDEETDSDNTLSPDEDEEQSTTASASSESSTIGVAPDEDSYTALSVEFVGKDEVASSLNWGISLTNRKLASSNKLGINLYDTSYISLSVLDASGTQLIEGTDYTVTTQNQEDDTNTVFIQFLHDVEVSSINLVTSDSASGIVEATLYEGDTPVAVANRGYSSTSNTAKTEEPKETSEPKELEVLGIWDTSSVSDYTISVQHPTSLNLNVVSDDKVVGTIELSSAKNWRVTEELPANAKLEVASDLADWDTSVEKQDLGYIVTNSYKKPENLNVKIKWQGADNLDSTVANYKVEGTSGNVLQFDSAVSNTTLSVPNVIGDDVLVFNQSLNLVEDNALVTTDYSYDKGTNTLFITNTYNGEANTNNKARYVLPNTGGAGIGGTLLAGLAGLASLVVVSFKKRNK